MSNQKRYEMGLVGKKKIEREFDRRIVVEQYMNEILNVEKKEVTYKKVELSKYKRMQY